VVDKLLAQTQQNGKILAEISEAMQKAQDPLVKAVLIKQFIEFGERASVFEAARELNVQTRIRQAGNN